MDYLLKPINQEKLFEVTSRLVSILKGRQHEQLQKQFEAALSGKPVSDLFSDVPSFSIALIKFGNYRCVPHPPVTLDALPERIEETSLADCIGNVSGKIPDWWIASANDRSCLFLLIPGHGAKNFRFVFDAISQAFPSEAVHFLRYPEPITFRTLAQAARTLMHHMELFLVPCVSQFMLANPGHSVQEEVLSHDVLCKLLSYTKPELHEPLQNELRQLLSSWRAQKISQHRLMEYLRALIHFYLKHYSSLLSGSEDSFNHNLSNLFLTAKTERDLYDGIFHLIEESIILPLFEGLPGSELYKLLKSYIEENYTQPITMDSLADSFHFSCSYITRVFKKYSGESPIRYLLEIRMKKAGEMILSDSDINIKEIAESVGYTDQHYFSRYFKQYYGVSPSAYKRLHTGSV